MADNSIGTQSFAEEKQETVTKKLRWAIVGCGGISATHLNAIKNIPQIEVVAGCDIKPERLKWIKENYGVEATYEKWDDLLREVKPDVVDVCTPNGVHCPAVVAALEAGAHSITEKPMAMNPAECQKMIDAAKANDRKLAVGFQYRYHPSCDFAVNAIKNGDIGDVLFVKVQTLRRRGIPNWGVFGQKALQGGGPMIDIGVHYIESAHYCIGRPKPIAASGNCWTYLGNKPSEVLSPWPNWDWKTYTVEDLCVGQVRFENGAIMQIESSFAAHIEKDVFNWTIVGTKGGYDFASGTLYTDRDGFMVNAKANYMPGLDFTTLFTAKLKNFALGVLDGTPLKAPGEDGLAVQKMIDGCYRSAEAGREVSID